MSIGGGQGGTVDLSEYLINFNSQDWANQANQYLTSALDQGTIQSQAYNQAAIDASKAYQGQSRQDLQTGYQEAMALDAPKQLATYGALDRYQDMLGLSRPEMGGYNLAEQQRTLPGNQQPGLFGGGNPNG